MIRPSVEIIIRHRLIFQPKSRIIVEIVCVRLYSHDDMRVKDAELVETEKGGNTTSSRRNTEVVVLKLKDRGPLRRRCLRPQADDCLEARKT